MEGDFSDNKNSAHLMGFFERAYIQSDITCSVFSQKLLLLHPSRYKD